MSHLQTNAIEFELFSVSRKALIAITVWKFSIDYQLKLLILNTPILIVVNHWDLKGRLIDWSYERYIPTVVPVMCNLRWTKYRQKCLTGLSLISTLWNILGDFVRRIFWEICPGELCPGRFGPDRICHVTTFWRKLDLFAKGRLIDWSYKRYISTVVPLMCNLRWTKYRQKCLTGLSLISILWNILGDFVWGIFWDICPGELCPGRFGPDTICHVTIFWQKLDLFRESFGQLSSRSWGTMS